MAKYVDGLQQIVPGANQLEAARRNRAPTQLGQVSSVPPESPNSDVLPHSVQAKIVPESYVALDHSLTIGALTLTLSPTFMITAHSAISNYLLALAAAVELFCVARQLCG